MLPIGAAMNSAWREVAQEWLGDAWTSIQADAFAARKLASIVLSHRGRGLELNFAFRRRIQSIMHTLRRDGFALLLSHETPLGSFMIAAATRCGVRVLALNTPKGAGKFDEAWIDRALIAIPSRVFVIAVKPEGKIDRLLRRRLNDDRFPTGSIFIETDLETIDSDGEVDHSKLVVPKFVLRDWNNASIELFKLGAVAHIGKSAKHAIERSESSEASTNTTSLPSSSVCLAPILAKPPSSEFSGQYLSHCTRGRAGAWPDQSADGYLADLLAQAETSVASATPFETLRRILTHQRLVATKRLKRADLPTVSFSAVPLVELLSRRSFRSHLGRWDWEPYGLCFRKDWLISAGCREVIYGDNDDFDQLSADEKPFFQPRGEAQNKLTSESLGHGWQEEKEWRIIDDLHLGAIPFEVAFAFVPTFQEALALSGVSRFPVLSLEGLRL
jgi:hypothetical protein